MHFSTLTHTPACPHARACARIPTRSHAHNVAGKGHTHKQTVTHARILTHIRTHVYYPHANTHMHTRMHSRTDTHARTNARMRAHTHTRTHTLARTHARTHARTRAHARTHARTHTRTRTHAYEQQRPTNGRHVAKYNNLHAYRTVTFRGNRGLH